MLLESVAADSRNITSSLPPPAVGVGAGVSRPQKITSSLYELVKFYAVLSALRASNFASLFIFPIHVRVIFQFFTSLFPLRSQQRLKTKSKNRYPPTSATIRGINLYTRGIDIMISR